MNLDLHEFETFPADTVLEIEADSKEFEDSNISISDLLRVKLTIQKVGEEFFCQGYVTAPVEEECSRCLVLFEEELAGDLSFIIKTGEAKSVLASDVEESTVIHLKPGEHVANIGGIVREAVLLAIPIKPLCDTDCRGFCPSCGANLNEETCDCKVDETDERWEELRDLLE
jgi:uncharacterized protein